MITRAMVSERQYLEMVAGDWKRPLEWYRGEVWEKPDDMAYEHNYTLLRLSYFLQRRIDIDDHLVSVNMARTLHPSTSYFIPDIAVFPSHYVKQFELGDLEAYRQPLALVVEGRSPSTGGYDIDIKLPEYKLRGDREIWVVDARERTILSLARQEDGSYRETTYGIDDTVRPVALPGVEIRLADIFQL